MTPERRKRITLSSLILILCGMLICAFFSLRHSPHHVAFDFAFFVLLLISSCLQYWNWYNSEHRQPDTLIHLFPASLATPKERS